MNYIFICSSLETGRDGVGDYTQLLATELVRCGHRVSLISFNDKYTSTIVESIVSKKGSNMNSIRLPSNISAKQRFNLLCTIINKENPDLVSIQYSGFGFHKYGLPIYLIRDFRKLTINYNFHIMFHELWCGMAPNAGIKEKILGLLQLMFIKGMFLKLKPKTIYTSILPYVNLLKKIGIESKLIPIFGTIDLNEFGSDQDWDLLQKENDLTSLISEPEKWIIISFFGTIYPCTGLSQLIQVCSEASHQFKKKFGIISFGLNRGLSGDIILRDISYDKYWNLDSLPVPMINRIIRLVNLGVVTSTADGIDKSTTAKAWLERSVPVIISSADKSYNKKKMKPLGVFQINNIFDLIEALNADKALINPDYLKKTVIAYENLSKVNK